MKKLICIPIVTVLFLVLTSSSLMINRKNTDALHLDMSNTSIVGVHIHQQVDEPLRLESNSEIKSENVSTVILTSSTTVLLEIPTVTEETTDAVTEESSVSETEETSSSVTTEIITQPTVTEPVSPIIHPLSVNPNIDPNKPMIVLTFDDGPSAYTNRLLDILNENGARATFFIVGKSVDYRKSTVERIFNEGHEVASHTWNHYELTRLDRQEIIDEITSTRDKLNSVTGGNHYLVRPPYGSFDDEVKSVGSELGVVYVNWSVDTLDWKLKDATLIHNKIMESAYNGAIILCHDIHKTTVDAMETVIPELIADGYQIVTFSEMMAFYHDGLESGRVYRTK